MKPTEYAPVSVSMPRAGLVALRGLLGVGGIGASRLLRPLVLLGATLGALAFSCVPAQALDAHRYVSELTGFTDPTALAFDSAGDLYVVDRGAKTVDRFGPSGAALAFSGSGGYIEGSKLTGSPTGAGKAVVGFDEPYGVAVDEASGDVYVSDSAAHAVDVFSSTGVYLSQVTGVPAGAPVEGPFKDPAGLAFDQATHELYVTDPGSEVVDVFSAGGAYLSQFGHDVLGGDFASVAVNDLTGDVYVGDSGSSTIVVFDASGTPVSPAWEGTSTANAVKYGGGGRFREGPLNVGIDPNTQHVYAAENHASLVEEFGSSTSEEYAGMILGPLTGSGSFAEDEGTFKRPTAVAVSPLTGDVYVANEQGGAVDVFGPDLAFPVVAVGAVSGLAAESVTLSGTVNPEGVAGTTCEFEYGSEYNEQGGYYTQALPCSHAQPLTGDKPVEVSATLTGLTPGTDYHYRLVSTNANSLSTLTRELELPGPESEFTTPGPLIGHEQARNIEIDAATLKAEVNPQGLPSKYRFEYDTVPYTSGARHGTSLTVEGVGTEAGIGSGTSAVPVEVGLKGLQPGRSYYYRVVVLSELEVAGHLEAKEFDGPEHALTAATFTSAVEGTCPNEQLRAEQPFASELADCRAYEMVSPLAKGDQGLGRGRVATAPSGEAVTYLSKGSFAEAGQPQAAGATLENRYIARRGSGGWSSQNITPPTETGSGDIVAPFDQSIFTPDLSQGITEAAYYPLTDETPAGYFNFYSADFATGSYKLVNTAAEPVAPYAEESQSPYTGWPDLVDASTDLSHVVYDQEGHVYEAFDGRVSQVDITPAGTNFAGSNFTGYDTSGGGTPSYSSFQVRAAHVVSGDGSRVFFTAGEHHYGFGGLTELPFGQLYVRENPMSASEDCAVSTDACTIEISASQKTNGTGPAGADVNGSRLGYGSRPSLYVDATPDGSKVFFTSRAELTNDANTGPEDNTANLYQYELSSEPGKAGKLTDLSVDTDPVDVEGASVLGVAAVSENGEYVYFMAAGDLAGTAASGQPNLYVYHAGQVKFIATLADDDHRYDWPGGAADKSYPNGHGYIEAQDEANEAHSNTLEGDPLLHETKVTADGEYMAFVSQGDLTGYDSEQAEPETAGGPCTPSRIESQNNMCAEVYVYDAATGQLACASCNPSGESPASSAIFGGYGNYRHSTGNLSEDGAVFFETPDPLVLHDSNGVEDVYEYTHGHVYPVSDVSGSSASTFADATTNGDDVFILTANQLVPADTDTREDLYDVRVNGGFPVVAAPAGCDNGDSCKGPVSPQPEAFGAPASATFAGAGNLTPVVAPPPKKVTKKAVKCKRGFVKNKRGKCVRKSKKKKTKAKKSAKGRA